MQVRIARHTDRLDELSRFYCEVLGCDRVGSFEEHDGYSGVFLSIPGTGTHLEFTSGEGASCPVPHPESLLVLYFDDQADVDVVMARAGVPPVGPQNPYWSRMGASALKDPDGFVVVLVPHAWGG